jgi:hypothetical protein
MPVTTESVIDEDVSGDGSFEGLAFAFDNDDSMEDDFYMSSETMRTDSPTSRMFSMGRAAIGLPNAKVFLPFLAASILMQPRNVCCIP